MNYQIFFTKKASEDLKSIKKYIYDDNEIAAKKVIEKIISDIDILKINPSLGRMGRILRTRELVISKYPYIIPYQIDNCNIYILRVLHTSKKWEI